MSKHLRSRVVGCLLTMAVAVIALAPAANAAQNDPVIQAPEANGTYLALGDSLAFGYQASKVATCLPTGCTTPDSIFNTGYVNDYAAGFTASGVNTVNLGCPGETSSTLINATNSTTGCTTYNAPPVFGGQPLPIHVDHPNQTQLQAAVDVLQSIGKRVSPITMCSCCRPGAIASRSRRSRRWPWACPWWSAPWAAFPRSSRRARAVI